MQTSETIRLSFWLEALVKNGVSVMFVGLAGTGKSVIIKNRLDQFNSQHFLVSTYSLNCKSILPIFRFVIPFSFYSDYTTSEMLQSTLEKPLEKKAGRTYGAPGNRQLIYFIGISFFTLSFFNRYHIDDFNMPERDKYYTVQAHTIVREYLDYQHWYDRQKLTLKEIRNCQFVISMNQNAGTFNIDPRLQRHFATFAVPVPNKVCSMIEGKMSNECLMEFRIFFMRFTRKCSK